MNVRFHVKIVVFVKVLYSKIVPDPLSMQIVFVGKVSSIQIIVKRLLWGKSSFVESFETIYVSIRVQSLTIEQLHIDQLISWMSF